MCLDGLPDGAFTMDSRAQPNLGGHCCQCHDRCHLVCLLYILWARHFIYGFSFSPYINPLRL